MLQSSREREEERERGGGEKERGWREREIERERERLGKIHIGIKKQVSIHASYAMEN